MTLDIYNTAVFHFNGFFPCEMRIFDAMVANSFHNHKYRSFHQITGRAERGDDQAKHQYIKRFPYAVVAPLTLWMVKPDMMKLTDNKLGFGKKLIWQSEE